MAENLNYNSGKSWCYGNNSANCEKYGRLYSWNDAQSACPAGWRIPNKEEWETLQRYAGGGMVAGARLKSNAYGGTDDFGWSALLGGQLSINSSVFEHLDRTGYWWTNEQSSNYQYQRYGSMSKDSHGFGVGSLDNGQARSVRCIKN
jgi:uncharacterized protein (TIGR02145 family)